MANILGKMEMEWPRIGQHGPASKRNLTFNLLDPDQIRLTLCYTDYFALILLGFSNIFLILDDFHRYLADFVVFS